MTDFIAWQEISNTVNLFNYITIATNFDLCQTVRIFIDYVINDRFSGTKVRCLYLLRKKNDMNIYLSIMWTTWTTYKLTVNLSEYIFFRYLECWLRADNSHVLDEFVLRHILISIMYIWTKWLIICANKQTCSFCFYHQAKKQIIYNQFLYFKIFFSKNQHIMNWI